MKKNSIRNEISPFDTLRLASLEVESWRIAKQKEYEEEEVDKEDEAHSSEAEAILPLPPQIDASWVDHGLCSGLG